MLGMLTYVRGSPGSGFSLVELLVAIAVLGLVLAILVPRFTRSRDRSAVTACGEHLSSIATALQTYANENSHLYPATLSTLTPNFLKTVPTCPAVSSDTYNAGYSKIDDPPNFTVLCDGTNHSGIGYGAGEPWFTLTEGLGPK